MVKAVNNVINDFVFDPEILRIPDRYKVEPSNFEDFTWVSQDGRIINIKKFDDNHLINLFKMLCHTILYGKELQSFKRLSHDARNIVETTDYYLQYVGYELHLRQQIYSTKKLSPWQSHLKKTGYGSGGGITNEDCEKV